MSNCNCVNLGPRNPNNPTGWEVIEVGEDGSGGYTGNYPRGTTNIDPTTQTVTLNSLPSSWNPPYYGYTGFLQLRLNCSDGSYTILDSWTSQNGQPTDTDDPRNSGGIRNFISSQTLNPCGASSPPPVLPTTNDPAACFAAASANPSYRIGLSCPQPPVVPPIIEECGTDGSVGILADLPADCVPCTSRRPPVAGSPASIIEDLLKNGDFDLPNPPTGGNSEADGLLKKVRELARKYANRGGMIDDRLVKENMRKILIDQLNKGTITGSAPPPDCKSVPKTPSRPPTKTNPPPSKPSTGGGGPGTGTQRPPRPPGPAPRPNTGRPPIALPKPPPVQPKPPFRWPQLPKWKPPTPRMPPMPGGLKPGIIGAIPGMILDPLLNPTELGRDDEIRPGHWRPPFQPPRDPFDDYPVWDDGPTFEPPDYEPPWMGEDPDSGMPVFFDNYEDYKAWIDNAYPSPPNSNWAWPGSWIPTIEIGPITYYGPQAIPGNSVIRTQISSDQRGNRLRLGDVLYTLTSTSPNVPVWPMYQADYYPRTTTNNIDRSWSGPIQIVSQGSGPKDLLAKASEGLAIITTPFVPNSPTLSIDKDTIDTTNSALLVNRQLLEAYAGNPPLSEPTVLVAKDI